MKKTIAFLGVLLFFAHAQASSPTGLGQIVTISGKISTIDLNQGTISLGYADSTYTVTNTSVLIIDGNRGDISGLKNGMKVSGSADTAAPETGKYGLRRLIRIMHATTEAPADNRTASTPAQAGPQFSPRTPGNIGPVEQEEREGFSKKLSGSFWTVSDLRLPNGMSGKQWVCLNAGGMITGERGPMGHWMVVGPSIIRVQYFMGGMPGTVRFNPEVNRGDAAGGFNGMPMMPNRPTPNTGEVTWTRIDSPTPDMVANAQNHSTSTSKSSASPSPTSTPAPPSASAEMQQLASNVVKANNNSLVFVTGASGAGSGFIANMEGTTYLVTNAHVAAGISDAGFKSLDGALVQGGAAEVAVGHDILRMVLPATDKAFELMKDIDQNAGVGDEVVVLGNAEGSGVINPIMGKIVGIGPSLIEIDAQFVPGSSGSPIVHLKSGQVIGVASYAIIKTYDATTKEKMPAPVIRRFGQRIDRVKTWQPVNWRTFYAQADTMKNIHALTEALDDFFRDIAENEYRVTPGRHTNPVIKTRISQWLESKSHNHSLADRTTANASFISFLKIACQSDLTNTQRGLTYDYFQRALAHEQEVRNEMAQAFTRIINDIRE